jgi:serine/threonine-protein kinase
LGVILYEMLTGIVPFTGSTPLAIAMKHASDVPRRPREIVTSIHEELERLILQALAKRPEDRPADAAAFRSQLLAIAERLGLEHAAVVTAPDLAALRNAGVESPSGRLIIDISRLRESRATTSGTSDLTIVREPAGDNSGQLGAVVTDNESIARNVFPRVQVRLGRNSLLGGRLPLLIGIVAAVVLLAAIAFLVSRSSDAPLPANVNAVASPSPTATPSPTPSPSPSPSPKQQATPRQDNANNKKDSKVGSFVKKVKRILKKPF